MDDDLVYRIVLRSDYDDVAELAAHTYSGLPAHPPRHFAVVILHCTRVFQSDKDLISVYYPRVLPNIPLLCCGV